MGFTSFMNFDAILKVIKLNFWVLYSFYISCKSFECRLLSAFHAQVK